MHAFRTFSRFWAFVCALAFLPWMQVAMARPIAAVAPCCAGMPGMASMAADMAVEHDRFTGHGDTRAERAFCQAACSNLSAGIPSSHARMSVTPLVVRVQRVELALPAAPDLRAWRSNWIAPPAPTRPPFLEARLQV